MLNSHVETTSLGSSPSRDGDDDVDEGGEDAVNARTQKLLEGGAMAVEEGALGA